MEYQLLEQIESKHIVFINNNIEDYLDCCFVNYLPYEFFEKSVTYEKLTNVFDLNDDEMEKLAVLFSDIIEDKFKEFYCVDEEIEEDNIAFMILEWDYIFWNGDAEESLFQLEKLIDIKSDGMGGVVGEEKMRALINNSISKIF